MNDNRVKIALIGTAIFMSGVTAFAWIKQTSGGKVINIAKKFLGQKEISPNKAFASKQFEGLMQKLGKWWSGAEWCASFARLVWLLALSGKQRELAKKMLSPSTQQTYVNFKNDKSGHFEVSNSPEVGSIVIWQSSTNRAKGHAGIYVGKFNGKYHFIEGNRNNAVTLMRYNSYEKISNILYLRGFIHLR